MKLICDCGNKEEFKTTNEKGEPNSYNEDEGQYVTIDKFDFWEQHDQVGIVCCKCKKGIWLFT